VTGDIVEKNRMAGGKFSDIEAASMVRMLMRGDLNHEFVCLVGRDRIMYLSQEVDRLTAENAKLKKSIVGAYARGVAANLSKLREGMDAAVAERDELRAKVEQLTEELRKAQSKDHDYMQCVAAVRSSRQEVERLAAERDGILRDIKQLRGEFNAKVMKARHEGRNEALDAVFQINGPSRAITRLKEKYAAEAVQG
jgi:uncharacterized coiled-coil DUF342 family protein